MKDEWTDRKRKKPKKYLSPVSAVLAEAVEEMRCRRAMCYSCNGYFVVPDRRISPSKTAKYI